MKRVQKKAKIMQILTDNQICTLKQLKDTKQKEQIIYLFFQLWINWNIRGRVKSVMRFNTKNL